MTEQPFNHLAEVIQLDRTPPLVILASEYADSDTGERLIL